MFGLLPETKVPDITRLQYPCYMGPVIGAERFIYVPDQGLFINGKKVEIKGFERLNGIHDHVLEGFFTENRLYFFDCIGFEDWEDKKNSPEYVDRLKLLRLILNDSLADYSRFIDLPMEKINNPGELIETYKKLLTFGNTSVNIRYERGKYSFEGPTGDFIELGHRDMK